MCHPEACPGPAGGSRATAGKGTPRGWRGWHLQPPTTLVPVPKLWGTGVPIQCALCPLHGGRWTLGAPGVCVLGGFQEADLPQDVTPGTCVRGCAHQLSDHRPISDVSQMLRLAKEGWLAVEVPTRPTVPTLACPVTRRERLPSKPSPGFASCSGRDSFASGDRCHLSEDGTLSP